MLKKWNAVGFIAPAHYTIPSTGSTEHLIMQRVCFGWFFSTNFGKWHS